MTRARSAGMARRRTPADAQTQSDPPRGPSRLRRRAAQLLLALAASAIFLRILDVTVLHRRTPALAVVLLLDPASVDCGALEKELTGALGFDPARDIVTVTAYLPESPQTEQIVITELRAHAVDLVIGGGGTISGYAEKGCFEEPLYPVSGLSGDLTAGIAVTSDHREAAGRALSYINGANSGGD